MNFGISVTAVAGTTVLALALGNVQVASAQIGRSGTDTWREEVLLHDGQTIIVERSQTYGGRHEVGQSPPVKEHTVRFTLPGSKKPISWTSEYGEDLGRTNFNILALHVKQGVPFVITEPNLCLSYNKWGRPNPPYVMFKFDNAEWKRIAIAELPIEFKTINLIVNTDRQSEIKEGSRSTGYVHSELVAQINENLRDPHIKTVLREPLPKQKIQTMCEELVRYKCGWGAPGEFNRAYFERICR